MITRREFLKASAAVAALAALAEVLPRSSSAFTEISSQTPSPQPEDGEEWVHTTCWIGKQDCGILARKINGRLVKLEGNPLHPRNRGKLCPKGQAQLIAVYDPYRIKAPLRRVNPKGQPGEWMEITWDEALSEVADWIRKTRQKNPKLILWQKGRSKAKAFYDEAFVKAIGATKVTHGAYCSDAGYRACEYTVGFHGVLHPDFKHCNYLLNWGWNITNAGGNKLCWITWNRQFVEARERGMKVVTIDPFLRGAAHHTDEWIPIKPGTDLAFFLAICNVLIQNGFVDRDYLRNHTNAPFLVKPDGYFLRKEGREQIWDKITDSAQPYDKPGVDPALEGEYIVEGMRVKPAFQLFKEHVAKYTPEWAADITGIPAEQIRRIGMELGENAKIGAKILLDGVELPYRPVGIMAYHITQQELGFQACRAALLIFMLLGAIEAVGGLRIDFARKVHKNFWELDEIEIKDPPYDFTLKHSKYFPINSVNPSIISQIMLDPARYEVDPNLLPEIAIIHMAEPITSFAPRDTMMNAYAKFKFVVGLTPWMTPTFDYYADIILPVATMEKYEGPLSATDQYVDAFALRLPPIEPLYKSRGEIDIYIDICEKAGVLYGPGGYLDILNKQLKLKDEYKLDLYTKPSVRDIFDRWAKSHGIKDGIEHFEKHGVYVKGEIPAGELYAPGWKPPYGGIRHRFYGESLKRYRDEMIRRGVDEIFYRDYTPFPTWRDPTFYRSPSEYDLILISFKDIVFKQSRSAFIPLLNELQPLQMIWINSRTAAQKGLRDGDQVWVESHNAVTGETRRLKTIVKTTELIRPDTVAISHHHGIWSHPVSKDSGTTPNELFPSGKGYVANTSDQSFHVKVKIWKA